MEWLSQYAKPVTGVFALCFSYLFGGWSELLIALVVVVSFDYLTGIIAAAYQGLLNSRVGFNGIYRKVLIFVVVALAGVLDKVFNSVMEEPLVFGQFELSLAGAVIIYYLFNEAISISENVGKAGVNIPSVLKKAIAIFKEESFEDERKDD